MTSHKALLFGTFSALTIFLFVKYSAVNSTNACFYTTSNFKYEKQQARALIPLYPSLVAMDSFTVSQ